MGRQILASIGTHPTVLRSFASSSCGHPPSLLLSPPSPVHEQAKVLSTLCLDLSFGNPLELCRGRYLSGCATENLQAFIEAAEEVMAKSCTTTLWLEVRVGSNPCARREGLSFKVSMGP